MLRGAIEAVAFERILGWAYSDAGSITGQTVLAFLDKTCIGSATVGLFREDLLAAGLNDGRLGFSIPIGNIVPEDSMRVTVRLEGSDFQLVQEEARVTGNERSLQPCPFLKSEARIEWMRDQHWLSQHDIDLAKQMIRIGVYDFSLRKLRQSADAGVADLMDPAEAAKNLLSLLHMEPIIVVASQITEIEAARDDQFLRALHYPVAAIWSKKRESIMVLEGSHTDEEKVDADDRMNGAVEYTCGPDRLLVTDLRCILGSKPGSTATKYTVFAVHCD